MGPWQVPRGRRFFRAYVDAVDVSVKCGLFQINCFTQTDEID